VDAVEVEEYCGFTGFVLCEGGVSGFVGKAVWVGGVARTEVKGISSRDKESILAVGKTF
jgi:hypothetical protein